MKKRTLLAALVCLCMLLVMPAAAAVIRVTDEADLLTDAQEQQLSQRLEQISNEYGADVRIVTVESTNGMSMQAFTEKYYDDHIGAGNHGVLLMISMELRDWGILGNGIGAMAFDSDTIEITSELMLEDLKSGDYYTAFEIFADECEYHLNGQVNGYPFDYPVMIAVCLSIGLVVAVIVVLIMKATMRSVRKKSHASDYMKTGSLHLEQSNDIYLYTTTNRVKRVQNTNSTGSGGSSMPRSYGGGKF